MKKARFWGSLLLGIVLAFRVSGLEAQTPSFELSRVGSLDGTGTITWSADSRWLLMRSIDPQGQVLRYAVNDLAAAPCRLTGKLANVVGGTVRTYQDSSAWEWDIATCAQTREIHYSEPTDMNMSYPWTFTEQIAPDGECMLVLNYEYYSSHFTAADMQWVSNSDTRCQGHFWSGYRVVDPILSDTYLAWIAVDSISLGESWGDLLFMPYSGASQPLASRVTVLALSPDGLRLAAGNADGQVLLFDTAAQTLEATLDTDIPQPINELGWTGQQIIAVTLFESGDHSMTLWDAESGQRLSQLTFGVSGRSWLARAVNPAGDMVAVITSRPGAAIGDFDIRETATGNVLTTEHGIAYPQVASWSPDGQYLLTQGAETILWRWNSP